MSTEFRIGIIKRLNLASQVVTGSSLSSTAETQMMNATIEDLLDMYEGGTWQRILALPVDKLLDIREKSNVRNKKALNVQ